MPKTLQTRLNFNSAFSSRVRFFDHGQVDVGSYRGHSLLSRESGKGTESQPIWEV